MRRALTLFVACVLLHACGSDGSRTAAPTSEPTRRITPWQRQGFVAHAFGSPSDGAEHTNSRQAFGASYAKGFRAFEVDLVLLRDGNVFCAHDLTEKRYGLPGDETFDELETDDLEGRKIDDRWTPLFGDDLIELMRDRPDITVLLDTKGDDHVAIAEWFADRAPRGVLERMVPHIHTQEQLDAVRRLDAFDEEIFATYKWTRRELLGAPAFMRSNDMDTVMVKTSQHSTPLHRALRSAGARWIFVASETDPEKIADWRERDVGVYSNGFIER